MFYALSLSQFSTTKTFLVIKPQPELVLKLFLNFGKFDPHCSYKVVLIKKKRVLVSVLHFAYFFVYPRCNLIPLTFRVVLSELRGIASIFLSFHNYTGNF